MQAKSIINRSSAVKLAVSNQLPVIRRRRVTYLENDIDRETKETVRHARPGGSMAIKIRFYISLALIYSSTMLLAWYMFSPDTFIFEKKPTPAVAVVPAILPQATPPPPSVISGKPVRIVVPRLGINLLVEEGNYDSIKHTWTLSAGNAHFATPSMPPNDYQGNTLVYGHNHDLVLGRLRNSAVGDIAQIFTENGPTFVYSFTNFENVKPDNMSAFKYQGPPTLIIQTCTGNWNETRGLYSFKFERVE